MRDQEIIGLEGAYSSIYPQTQELKEEKDATEIGITGLPIPKKKRSPAKQHELEKKRRMRKHLGKNVGGEKYSSDVNPYFNPRSVREEVLSYLLDEGFASDEKSAKAIMGAMSEVWIESIVEKFELAADPSKPQSPKPTTLARKRKRHDDWEGPDGEKLKQRMRRVVGTQRRQDTETGVTR